VVGILLFSAKAAQQALGPSLSRSPSHGRIITAVPGVTGSKETKIGGISGIADLGKIARRTLDELP